MYVSARCKQRWGRAGANRKRHGSVCSARLAACSHPCFRPRLTWLSLNQTLPGFNPRYLCSFSGGFKRTRLGHSPAPSQLPKSTPARHLHLNVYIYIQDPSQSELDPLRSPLIIFHLFSLSPLLFFPTYRPLHHPSTNHPPKRKACHPPVLPSAALSLGVRRSGA
jgi:hypothetical protein